MKQISIIIILFAVSISLFAGGKQEQTADQPENTMMKQDNSGNAGSAMMMKADNSSGDGNSMMMMGTAPADTVFDLNGYSPKFIPFTSKEEAQFLAGKGKTIYFFAASWCPNCRRAYNNFTAQVDEFPDDMFIVFVNYDTQKELKQQYGVTYQHTFVQIDTEGNELAIWSGSENLQDLQENIK